MGTLRFPMKTSRSWPVSLPTAQKCLEKVPWSQAGDGKGGTWPFVPSFPFLGGETSKFFWNFHPEEIWGNDVNLTCACFSIGLVQPPTSLSFCLILLGECPCLDFFRRIHRTWIGPLANEGLVVGIPEA